MATNTTSSEAPTAAGKRRAVAVSRIDTVPPDARVRHFDELDERTQQVLADLDGEEALVPVAESVADEIGDGVVVFTEYYRVDVR
ncbi:hypothetical protein [Halomicrococcus sp. NG-SE-24]|uniref:hypothetical protein n=1 Tax=Halomicrococcus sp. NG-SE-24 TaxID=3436928 RepID=UPI003D98853E